MINIIISEELKSCIVEILNDRFDLEVNNLDLEKIEKFDDFLIALLSGRNLRFQFRVRDPEFAWGENSEEALEHFEPIIYDDDEQLFTGDWEVV